MIHIKQADHKRDSGLKLQEGCHTFDTVVLVTWIFTMGLVIGDLHVLSLKTTKRRLVIQLFLSLKFSYEVLGSHYTCTKVHNLA